VYDGVKMYICKNCGNSEKFIGYVQEQGKAFIYQNNYGSGGGQTGDVRNHSKNNKVYTDLISENFSWAYFLSDKDWKSSLRLKKCYYCNSSEITWR
jgi:hypothetical protein